MQRISGDAARTAKGSSHHKVINLQTLLQGGSNLGRNGTMIPRTKHLIAVGDGGNLQKTMMNMTMNLVKRKMKRKRTMNQTLISNL